MTNATEIYAQSVIRLPSAERLRLAALIINGLAQTTSEHEPFSVLELIESFPRQRGFRTSAEVDEYLRQERDSWDD